MINIVVLMAGEGKRFKDAGYKRAKPFIEISGKMMIEYVLEGIKTENSRYILVVRESFFTDYSMELKYIKDKYNTCFSSVREITTGALSTALSVYGKIAPSDPVVFVDSDNLFDNAEFNNFLNFSILSECDGCVLTSYGSSDKFSYIELDRNKLFVSRIAEKEVISNMAISGAYMFSRGALFERCAINTIIYPIKEKEYYMSTAYNTLINMGGRVKNFQMDVAKWKCLGTPDQLKKFVP